MSDGTKTRPRNIRVPRSGGGTESGFEVRTHEKIAELQEQLDRLRRDLEYTETNLRAAVYWIGQLVGISERHQAQALYLNSDADFGRGSSATLSEFLTSIGDQGVHFDADGSFSSPYAARFDRGRHR